MGVFHRRCVGANRVLQLDVYTIYARVNLQFALKLLATVGSSRWGTGEQIGESREGWGREGGVRDL